ncbi:hypothetical protein [Haloimpatiens lingqiaonensis]|uniref:hypothetical protein n=1 Tax=Haloimpatiens lingqiaonensis TaxID=1380675 RepID=UPI0010FE8F6D|nr:hypothetical protein [Haloimpatiens lingqiaonensis]
MLCPFLTTDKEKVECFSECAFFEYELKGSKCPFKNSIKSEKYKKFCDKDFEEDEFQEQEKYIKEIYS